MKAYRIGERSNSQRLWQYLTENERILLPMVELIEASRMAIDALTDVLSRANVEAGLPGCRPRQCTVSCFQPCCFPPAATAPTTPATGIHPLLRCGRSRAACVANLPDCVKSRRQPGGSR